MEETTLNGVQVLTGTQPLQAVDFQMKPMDIRTFKFEMPNVAEDDS